MLQFSHFSDKKLFLCHLVVSVRTPTLSPEAYQQMPCHCWSSKNCPASSLGRKLGKGWQHQSCARAVQRKTRSRRLLQPYRGKLQLYGRQCVAKVTHAAVTQEAPSHRWLLAHPTSTCNSAASTPLWYFIGVELRESQQMQGKLKPLSHIPRQMTRDRHSD